jgi:hypothetical protein
MKTVAVTAFGALGICLATGSAQATPLPGPDAFGYTGSGIANNLRNVAGSGTQVSLGDDQVSGALNIGFSFDFYGSTYSSVYVSSNGFLTFTGGGSSGCCTGQALPTSDGINNLIAGLWEDLDTNGNSTGTMWYDVLGVAGSREFVMGFYDVAHFPSGNPTTFEMILHEGSNDIELQYGRLSGDGGTHSVGIENATGTIGLQVLLGSDISSLANTGLLISDGGTHDVPEPATLGLMGVGLAGIAFGARRRRKSA